MSGQNDLSQLFKRVTALERGDDEAEQSVTRIVKHYTSLGMTVTITTRMHQYRITGDINPLYSAVTSTDTYL